MTLGDEEGRAVAARVIDDAALEAQFRKRGLDLLFQIGIERLHSTRVLALGLEGDAAPKISEQCA